MEKRHFSEKAMLNILEAGYLTEREELLSSHLDTCSDCKVLWDKLISEKREVYELFIRKNPLAFPR